MFVKYSLISCLKKQNGFALIGILIAVFIITILSYGGWSLFSRKDTESKSALDTYQVAKNDIEKINQELDARNKKIEEIINQEDQKVKKSTIQIIKADNGQDQIYRDNEHKFEFQFPNYYTYYETGEVLKDNSKKGSDIQMHNPDLGVGIENLKLEKTKKIKINSTDQYFIYNSYIWNDEWPEKKPEKFYRTIIVSWSNNNGESSISFWSDPANNKDISLIVINKILSTFKLINLNQ